jgi:hypothetical protein
MTIFLLGFVWHAFVKPFVFGITMLGGCGHHEYSGPIPVVKTGDTPYSKPKMHYDFPDATSTFFVKQEQKFRLPSNVNLFGSVNFVASGNDKTAVDFHVHVSDQSLWDSLKIDARKDGVVFSAGVISIVEQYINVTAVVSLSKHEDLKKFFVSTVQLDVKVDEGVKNKFDVSRINTVAGNVHLHGTHSAKCTKVKSVSGNVRGTFDLVKNLDFKTVSGDIDISTNVIDLDEEKAWIGTESASGNTKVHVIHPLHSRDLKSWHKSASGNIDVRYPEEWQGSMTLSSTSGDFKLLGKHLDVKKKKKGITGKLWKAIKGNGSSRAKIESVSGDVKVSVGDE